MANVYINMTANALPNDPISNDEMESFLGKVGGESSKARRIVLRNNGIKSRYYAINSNQEATHSNTELTSQVIENLMHEGFTKNDIEVLSCGTSTPDVMLPSHAAMVHGLLKNKSVELNSSTGVCCSGMNALKYGFLSVKSGESKNAVCTASERASSLLVADKFNSEVEALSELNEKPIIAFKKDFLRWMLSDGAGAFLLENEAKGKQSLKIEWMKSYSYAHELEVCMYAGGDKLEDGTLKAWSDYKTEEWLDNSIFSIKQDVKVLDKHILVKGVESMKDALEKNNVAPESIDYFLPHISSYYFADKLKSLMADEGVNIPEASWFMNLDRVGNVGSASIYLMLDELFHSGKLKKGDSILLSVPESGRFSYAYAFLTVC